MTAPAAELTEAALEAALCAFEGIGGIAVVREPDLTRTIAPGRPYGFLNGAFALDLDPSSLADRVRQVGRTYREAGLALTWWITPRSRPADLDARLAQLGLARDEDEAGMALDLGLWQVSADPPSGVTIEVVRDRERLHAWVDVMAASYGWADPDKARTLRELYDAEPDDGIDRPGIQLLARRDGEPVGCGSLFEAGGHAWVTNIGTVPAARGRGVGGAVTVALLDLARERGHRLAHLAASVMGEPVYRRLGFVVTCRLGRFSTV